MLRRPIGVWFSLALLILILGGWLGYEAGIGIARVRNRAKLRTMGSLSAGERAHLESVLPRLSSMSMLRFAAIFGAEKVRSTLLFQIGKLESLRSQSDLQEVRAVADLDLGVFYAQLAMVEERANNASKAREYMELARGLFRSLGWQDCSEGTLKAVAQREFDKWASKPGGKVTQK
jgi:hypothetical protein